MHLPQVKFKHCQVVIALERNLADSTILRYTSGISEHPGALGCSAFRPDTDFHIPKPRAPLVQTMLTPRGNEFYILFLTMDGTSILPQIILVCRDLNRPPVSTEGFSNLAVRPRLRPQIKYRRKVFVWSFFRYSPISCLFIIHSATLSCLWPS